MLMGQRVVVGANLLRVMVRSMGNMADDWLVDTDDQQEFLHGAGYADLWCVSGCFMS